MELMDLDWRATPHIVPTIVAIVSVVAVVVVHVVVAFAVVMVTPFSGEVLQVMPKHPTY